MRSKFGMSLLLLFISSSAFAVGEIGYSCNLRIWGADSQVVIDENFTTEASGGTHGGRGANFASKDGKTQATVAVDGKWIILNWTKNGTMIANIIFVVANPSQESRVAIAYNPANLEEQATLNCEPVAAVH